MSAFRGVNPETFGRELAGVIAAAIDQRLGTTRPAKMQAVSLPLSHVQKFMSAGKRIVRGIASTESLDRQGDRVDPRGGQWDLPLPLLFGHSHRDVIGVVRAVKVTSRGLEIEAEIAEGIARADEAWKLIELGGLNFYSIGFLGQKGEPIPTGVHWRTWTLVEISIVPVPANADARIERSSKAGTVKLIQPRPVVKLIQPR